VQNPAKKNTEPHPERELQPVINKHSIPRTPIKYAQLIRAKYEQSKYHIGQAAIHLPFYITHHVGLGEVLFP
jgi:hypothetical protein